MTPGQAAACYDRWEGLLSAAETAIDCARRNLGRRNGFYSTEPQLREARHQLELALQQLPLVEEANAALG